MNKKKERLAGIELKTALLEACRGLVFISETDSPVNVIFISPQNDLPGGSDTVPAGTRSPDPKGAKTAIQFFDRLTTYKDWHSEENKRSVRRYRRLRNLLFDNLDEIRLIRLGRVRIEIFVTGKDAEGNIVGIKIMAVET